MSLGFIASASYYLSRVETDISCKSLDGTDFAWVQSRAILFVLIYHGIDCIRNLVALAFFIKERDVLESVYSMLGLNGCFGVAVLVCLHLARLDTCSEVLPARTQLVKGYIAAYWAILGAQCLCCCTVCIHQA